VRHCSSWNMYELGDGVFIRYRLVDDTVQVEWKDEQVYTFTTRDAAYSFIEGQNLKEQKESMMRGNNG